MNQTLPKKYQVPEWANIQQPKVIIHYRYKTMLIHSYYIAESLKALGANTIYVEGVTWKMGQVLILSPELQYRFKQMIHGVKGAFEGVKWSRSFSTTHPVLGPLRGGVKCVDGVLETGVYTWWYGRLPLIDKKGNGDYHEHYQDVYEKVTLRNMRKSLQDEESEKHELIKKWVLSVGGEIREEK